MSEITIRDECEADHARVHEIQEAAFGQPGEANLVDVLRRSARPQLSLVAEIDGDLAGHVFLSPVTIENNPLAVECAGLAPIGVDPSVQGIGIGAALMGESIRRCPDVGWQAVFLLGDPGYYSRFGFGLAADSGFHFESEFFDSAFQIRELTPGILSSSSGWVHYHEAFSEL